MNEHINRTHVSCQRCVNTGISPRSKPLDAVLPHLSVVNQEASYLTHKKA